MIRLNKLTEDDEKAHIAAWAAYVKETLIDNCATLIDLYPGLLELVPYLIDDVEDKLIYQPPALREQIDYVKDFHPDIDSAFSKSAKTRTANEKLLVEAFESAYNYDKFSDAKKKWGAYHLVGAYKQRICPYCQGSHINYHQSGDGRMRPALDHFYPASKYPYLAISLYNLIPSCHQCNSSIKSSADPFELIAPHPFEFVEAEVIFSIDTAIWQSAMNKDDLKIHIRSTTPAAKAHLDLFALQARYQWYTPEIADVCRRTRKWQDAKGPLQGLITRESFACGFEKTKSHSRILGNCLIELSEQISKLAPS